MSNKIYEQLGECPMCGGSACYCVSETYGKTLEKGYAVAYCRNCTFSTGTVRTNKNTKDFREIEREALRRWISIKDLMEKQKKLNCQ